MTRHLRVWAVLAVLAAGCGDSSDAELAAASGIAPQCAGAGECGPGMTCHEGYGVCTVSEGPALRIAIVAEPPVSAALVPRHEADLEVGPDNSDIDVVLPKTVRISGQVRVTGNALDAGVQATIFAVATEETIAGAYRATQADADTDYELLLQADTVYDVRIRVDDSGWPAFVTQVSFSEDQQHVFWLPEEDSYPVLSGFVKRLEAGMPQGIKNVLVTARETTTGQQCASSVTDSRGGFTLTCPSPGSYAVRVAPGEASDPNEDVLIPSFDVVLDGKAEFMLDADGRELAPVIIGDQARKTKVEIAVLGDGEPIEFVTVSAWTRLDSDPRVASEWKDTVLGAVLRQDAVTDASGRASFELLDGTYTLTVTPHTSAKWASTTLTDWNIDSIQSQTIELQRKPELTGAVTTWQGEAVPLARIEAAVTVIDPATGTSTQRTFAVEADEEGRYALPVDPGAITMTVIPPAESAQPRWISEVMVSQSATINVPLSRPSLLEGVVLTSDGAVVEKADIDVLGLRPNGSPMLLGTATSNAEGRYLIILPAPAE